MLASLGPGCAVLEATRPGKVRDIMWLEIVGSVRGGLWWMV